VHGRREEVEQAFNEFAKDLMVPKKDEFLIRAVYDETNSILILILVGTQGISPLMRMIL
jgi:hypothetical protein